MPTRQIRDIICKQKILSVSPTITVREAVKKMAAAHVGTILIIENNQLIGIFTERDALNRVLSNNRDPDTTILTEVMTPNPKTIKPDLPFAHAMCVMHDNNFRHLPVVENDIVLGIVSARDALGQEMVMAEKEIARQENLTELL